jgi:ribosome-associated heat shock protein Hsp15
VQGGHVRVNGERARTSIRVHPGDEIRLQRQQLEYVLKVVAIPVRRGPASDAKACYQESEESVSRREQRVAELRRDRLRMPTTRGKPDKHTRRRLRQRNRDAD